MSQRKVINIHSGGLSVDNAIELQDHFLAPSNQSEDEDLHTKFDEALLRNHRDDGNDDVIVSMTEPKPSATQRLWNFMSKVPLLKKDSRSSLGPSYATIPSEYSSRRGSEDRNDASRSKGKGPLLGESASIAVLRGDEAHVHSGSETQQVTRERRSLPSLVDGIAIPLGDGTKLSEDLGPILAEEALDETSKSHDAILDIGTDQDENPPDNSPFPQVRASVSATDNTALSICTPRMWILSLFFAFLGSATNLFFSLRYPSVAITPIIALVLVHPLGRAWDFALKYEDDPKESFEHGYLVHSSEADDAMSITWTRRWRLWLAQGRWNEKEHAMVYISSNVSFGFAFATDVQPAFPSLAIQILKSSRSLLNKQNSTIRVLPSPISCF